MSLQHALLLSIALHALLLFGLPPRQPPGHKTSHPAVLIARLVNQPDVEKPPAAVKPVPALRKAAPAARRGEPMPQPVPQEVASAPQLEQAQFDPSLVARYRLEIIAAAKQFKRYPPLAREHGWQGRAEVRVIFGGAREPALAVSRSSGYAVLDRQAVETLTSALPALPPPLLGHSFQLDFPVVFSLEE
jgi:periplasmic protein TonB